ncbi:MAG: FHA domain-containing protein [Magnetococcales bacterium]|nr:FHA domain-containing protein [Magnetococcales bacterium]NGZ26679.1 FHA domain-containing protein [Magnetococcales bacterium]
MFLDWLFKLFESPPPKKRTKSSRTTSGSQLSAAELAQQKVGDGSPKGVTLLSLVNSAGRINYVALQSYLEKYGAESILSQLPHPVFMGQELLKGRFLSRRARSGTSSGVDGTSLFVENTPPPPSSRGNLREPPQPDSMGGAIYVLLKEVGNSSFFTIGRTGESDLTFNDNSVSKEHAELSIVDGHYFLRDTNSTNGTTLNGKNVKHEPVEIRAGDEVVFGRLAFQFISPATLLEKLKEL